MNSYLESGRDLAEVLTEPAGRRAVCYHPAFAHPALVFTDMRIAITSVQVPFVSGGAEYLVQGLRQNLQNHGHEVDVITMPFRFQPAAEVLRSMEAWSSEDLRTPNGIPVDRVICVKFPAYLVRHPQKVLWLTHQHRWAYELWNNKGTDGRCEEDWKLRWAIRDRDRQELPHCGSIYTISQNVSARLRYFSGVDSQPLYHPPPLAEQHFQQDAEPFVFFPSRLEFHKRQDLLIRAMAKVRSGVKAIIAGRGGSEAEWRKLIHTEGVADRVQMVGSVSRNELLDLYSRCLAVFFAPFEEDYGYVTLEAMLSSKPVITCVDSGGPLEFVVEGETGRIVEPTPQAVADAIDNLANQPARAAEMGRAGYERYGQLKISWQPVIEALTR